jgi:hypothetical protein
VYRNQTTGVHHALFNIKDPRTYPRYAVTLTAACLFTFATANSYWYHNHHFDVDVKSDSSILHTHNERPVQMVRTVSNAGGIVMNAKRYETLRHYGLGVDKDDVLAAKK